jgi:SAM-dependent methyltransferase
MIETQTIEPAIDNEELDMTDLPAKPEPFETATIEPSAPVVTEEYVDEYADATRYDLEYGTHGADLPFYLGVATAPAGSAARVLDVASGTGRVAIALAAAGHDVTAVDINAGLIELASEKDESGQVKWVEQDARELKVRGKFDVAILAGNSLQQFLTNDDRAAVLQGIYRQLNPGGTLAFGIRFPHATELSRRVETPEIWHSYTDAGGSQVVVSGTQRYDAATQVMTHETYRQYAVDGSRAATPTTTAIRYSYPQELVAALAAARFEVEAMYADFNGTPLTAATAPAASALVVVARKPKAKTSATKTQSATRQTKSQTKKAKGKKA